MAAAAPNRTGALVELRGAVKRFAAPEGGTVTALDEVTLNVGANEFVTLLGPSGCGKTTLLRCLSGFEDLDEGMLSIDGRPMAGVPAHRRPVNTVFQSYALFPHMTVAGNVAYSLEVAHVPREERIRRVGEALALVNLTGLDRRRPASSPAASSSAWRWPARSSAGRRSCCWTSPSRRSTADSGRPCSWS
jgi:spermidine/putrescine transport system ATP-binding protein